VWRRRGPEEGEEDEGVRRFQSQRPECGFAGPRHKVPEGPNARKRRLIPRPDFVVHRHLLMSPRVIRGTRDEATEARTRVKDICSGEVG
jgi:hypothetical protein